MIEVNWAKDYEQEFICPKCEKGVLKFKGSNGSGNKYFRCDECERATNASCKLKAKKKFFDPNTNEIWFYGQKIDNFICPKCEEKSIVFIQIKQGKKQFMCKNCGRIVSDSINMSRNNLSRYGHREIPVIRFVFASARWDLRSIYSVKKQEKRYIVYFHYITQKWLRVLVKEYIYHLCKSDISISTIEKHMTVFKLFSRYLLEHGITSINEINRSLVIDFISYQSTSDVIRQRLRTLRDFFTVGNLYKWFEVDQDIIKGEDYPKWVRKNPDPISDIVREQIENNLHKLPEPIARMWIIAFFTAMRCNELALLKKDCLVQEGSNWKIVWHRKKGKDQHEVPVTRVIAKVVQEQQDYINNLWGSDWDYLFCHYQDISATIPNQPNIKPVKKIIPKNGTPLMKCIRCLIKAEDIKDENDKLAKFQSKLIRPTRLTQLFEQGHDLAVVSAWAGHKRLVTTSLHYTKVSCELIAKEAGHIQTALFNAEGKPLYYESMPKSFWENPTAHKLELPSDHINTPIYGYCGLPLEQRCYKFRACYNCPCFVATQDKLSQYKKVRDELRGKEANALANGHDVLVEQFGSQAEQLDKIISSLEGVS